MIGNLPTEHTRSHWAVFLIVLVVILFGLFWFKESREIEKDTNALPLATTPLPRHTAQQQPADNVDLSSLEASAVNLSIPSFENVF